MRTQIFPLALGACAFFLPTEGRTAVTCSATVSEIVFGEVYLRNSITQQTTGRVDISCIGGTGGEVRACLSLGQGSGGTTTARNMRRTDGEPLAYQLSSGGPGGPPWNTVEFAVPLDVQGQGEITASIYAEILSSGPDIKGGSYSSSFSGGDVLLRYGEGSCDAGGSSTPSPFQVSARVSPQCTVTVGAMRFGDISAQLAIGAEAAASLDITCTGSAPYAVTLGPGLGANVSGPEGRQMSNGTQTLAYGLYQPGGSLPWGWTLGKDDLGATGSGISQTFTVHGRVHAGQEALTGHYTDSVVVTVHY